MSAIRATIMSLVLVLVVTAAVYFAAVPLPAMAAKPAASCPVPGVSAFSLSNEALWNILNGRYQRRIDLPR